MNKQKQKQKIVELFDSENTMKEKVIDTITFEFPSIKTNGTYFDLGLRKVVDTPKYKITFIKGYIEEMIISDLWREYLCYAEYWIIKKYYSTLTLISLLEEIKDNCDADAINLPESFYDDINRTLKNLNK